MHWLVALVNTVTAQHIKIRESGHLIYIIEQMFVETTISVHNQSTRGHRDCPALWIDSIFAVTYLFSYWHIITSFIVFCRCQYTDSVISLYILLFYLLTGLYIVLSLQSLAAYSCNLVMTGCIILTCYH